MSVRNGSSSSSGGRRMSLRKKSRAGSLLREDINDEVIRTAVYMNRIFSVREGENEGMRSD